MNKVRPAIRRSRPTSPSGRGGRGKCKRQQRNSNRYEIKKEVVKGGMVGSENVENPLRDGGRPEVIELSPRQTQTNIRNHSLG